MLLRFIGCLVLTILSLQLTSCKNPLSNGDGVSSNRTMVDPLADAEIMFDWNQASNETICSGLKTHNQTLSIGTKFDPHNLSANRANLDNLQAIIETDFADSATIVSREDRLAILTIELVDCDALGPMRALSEVKFVEPKYLLPMAEDDIFQSLIQIPTHSVALRNSAPKDPSINPAFYDPATTNLSYPDYIRQVNGNIADAMDRHGITKIYEQHQYFGKDSVGVAVIDNGIFPEWEDYVSQGKGSFEARGYYTPFSTTGSTPDGTEPQADDVYGIMQSIKAMFAHGTRQMERVYSIAPHINLISARSSSFVVWFQPSQFRSVTAAILALAEDPKVRIISSSMGTIFHIHEIERAIDYFNSFDKLFISAAGTSVPFVKDAVKVVFPANLPSTISTTGIVDTQITGNNYVLGENAHGGVENDFVVDHADSSSESVSASAGMIGLLWSANPELKRDQLFEILIRNSSNYRRLGRKDPIFGWGKIDMYQAFLDVKAASPNRG